MAHTSLNIHKLKSGKCLPEKNSIHLTNWRYKLGRYVCTYIEKTSSRVQDTLERQPTAGAGGSCQGAALCACQRGVGGRRKAGVCAHNTYVGHTRGATPPIKYEKKESLGCYGKKSERKKKAETMRNGSSKASLNLLATKWARSRNGNLIRI